MIDNFSKSIMELRYSWDKEDGTKETWDDIAERVSSNVLSAINIPEFIRKEVTQAIKDRKLIPGGRYLAQAGRPFHQTNNCFTLRAEDTREGWGELTKKATVALMTGGGIGVDYSDIRENGAPLKRTGGVASGPIPLIKSINEIGRGVMAGGSRRSAIWAGLSWNHPDIGEFIKIKNWSPEVRALKENDFDFPATCDMTNVSVILDKDFFDAYENEDNPQHLHAKKIYWDTIHRMLKTGEPGFSVNYSNKRESLRNACTEIVSDRDSDVCSLASINLAKIENIEELEKISELGVIFLLAGTEYSDVPFSKVKEVREEYRRIGLGMMGIAEWFAMRNLPYGTPMLFEDWLTAWQRSSDKASRYWSSKFGLNEPVAVRAIAPNGSTSIAGGQTTGGIEPIFSKAYQRRYLTPDGWKKQYVVDNVAERLYRAGVDISDVDDAYTLSQDVERRIAFQALVQHYVDNSISSTINLPPYGQEGNNDETEFGEILYDYLPLLRGITVYPDGARGGQPLTPVDFKFALARKDVVFEGHEDCGEGICGL